MYLGCPLLCVTWVSTLLFCRGWQGLIAYGCHSLVVVVDASTAQTLQVLEKHKADVVKVSPMPLWPCNLLSVLQC